MPSMSVLVPVAVVVLSLLTIFWTWTRWSMGQGARVLLRGLGTVLMLVGLYLAGLGELAGNGIRSIYDWAHRTVMTTPMMVGFAIAAVGLLFWIIGSFLRARSREQAKATRVKRKGQGAAPAPLASSPAARKPAKTAPADDEDEVNAILNKHGIQ